MVIRRNSEAALRTAERRKREDDAERLHAEVPRLVTLRLEMEERRGSSVVGGSAHVRHIVVDTAPALFNFPCGDRTCLDGGHDVTREILSALDHGELRFEGEHPCRGRVGSSDCENILHYVAIATYRPG